MSGYGEEFSETGEDLTDYDAVLNDLQNKSADDGGDPTNYDSVFSVIQNDRENRVKAVFETSLKSNPDFAAESAKLAKSSGLDRALVERNIEDIRRKEAARQLDTRSLADGSPILMQNLQDPNFTTQAHDDLYALSKIESTFKQLPKGVEAGYFYSSAGVAGALRSVVEFADQLVTTRGQSEAEKLFSPLPTLSAAGDFLFNKPLLAAAQYMGTIAKDSKLRAEEALAEIQGETEQGIIGGVASLTSNVITLPLLFLPGGGQAYLGTMITQVFGQAYQDAREKGLDLFRSAQFASGQGGIEYLTEKIPLGKLLGGMKAGDGFFKTMMKTLAAEIPGEQAATFFQDLNEWATLNVGTPIQEFIDQRGSAAYQTLLATIVGTGGQTSLAYGGRIAIEKFSNNILASELSTNASRELQNLLTNAGESKLRGRNAEVFMATVANMSRDESGAEPLIYVDAERLAQVAPEIMEQMPSIASQMEGVVGTIAIPISEALAVAPGTPLEAVLVEHGRIGNPEALSKFEADTATADARETLEAEAAKVIQQATDQTPILESRARVQEAIQTQLNALGRFSKSVNADYAKYVGAFYTAIGSRLGMNPEQAMARYPLKIVNQPSAGEVLQQTSPDTPEFRQWFGGSKVVDAEGRPLQLYHGASKSFSKFKGDWFSTNSFFTSDPDVAAGYAEDRSRGWYVTYGAQKEGPFATKEEAQRYKDGEGGMHVSKAGNAQIYPVYLSLQNPLVIDAKGLRWNQLSYKGETGITTSRIAYVASKEGYDGLIVRNVKDNTEATTNTASDVYVTFNRRQIKSSIANRGTFDPKNPDILAQSDELSGGGVLRQRVSTRLPTAVKAVENPLEDNLLVGLESSKLDPKAFGKNALIIAKYDGVNAGRTKNPDSIVEAFLNHAVANLLWLYDSVDPETRERSKLWYVGARLLAEEWAKKYNLTDSQVAAVIAVLSPQKDWMMNVDLARRVLEVLGSEGETSWSPEMSKTARRIVKARHRKAIIGKTLAELKGNDLLQAMWIRVYDETYNDRGYNLMSPEGAVVGRVMKGKGKKSKEGRVAWGGYGSIAKAVSVYHDGALRNVSDRLGSQHKVRNFYNNIFSPESDHGDVTIDTHAVAAALLLPLSGNSKEVGHNFGSGAASSSIFGSKGTYGLYAEAYRRAAAERGVKPREMQSITWEAVRGLFTPVFKRNKAKVKETRNTWRAYKNGKLTEAAAREQILALAGGIELPEWAGSDPGVSEAGGTAADQGQLDRSGGTGGTVGSGDRGVSDGSSAGPRTTLNQSAGPFFSGLIRAVESLKLTKGSPEQWLATLRNTPGIKPEELEWYDIGSAIKGQKSVTKEQILDYLRANELQVTETVLGADDSDNALPKFSGYQTPGGENYRELLITLPSKMEPAKLSASFEDRESVEDMIADTIESGYGFMKSDQKMVAMVDDLMAGKDVYETIMKYVPNAEVDALYKNLSGKKPKDYLAGHFDTPNVVAHIRFNERTDANGKRVLFIEEIQSDWHQKGRKHGYKSAPNDGKIKQAYDALTRELNVFFAENGLEPGSADDVLLGLDKAGPNYAQQKYYLNQFIRRWDAVAANVSSESVPDAPFKTTWPELALKRAVRWAAENGFDSVAWTTGEQQSERYDLSRHIEQLIARKASDGTYTIDAKGKGGSRGIVESGIKEDRLDNLIGKELSEKIIAQDVDRSYSYSGLDLKVGGEGMKGFYDKILPAAASKIGKKYGAKVGTTRIGKLGTLALLELGDTAAEDQTMAVHSIPITPELREAAMQGQPLFQTNRGTYDPENMEISLTDNADLSTFLHETAHFFLEVLADVASQPNQNPSFTRDMDAVLKWFGISDLATWQGMTLEQKRPYHERFAESFEQYLLEGKAPSQELQPLFRRFKAFMLQVYKSLSGMEAGFTGPETIRLSDDIRRVFDRLIATEEEIAIAEDKAGMSPDQEATAEAEEKLSARSIADLKWSMNARAKAIKRIQNEASEVRKVILADVKNKVKAMPVYAVQEWIKGRGLPDGTEQAGAKIDVAALVEMYGDSPASPRRYLATNLVGSDGLHPDIIAGMFGFSNGDTMIREIIAAPSMRDMVNAMTDEQMLRENGDLVNREAVEEAANQAVHNEARAKSLATELKAQTAAVEARENTGRLNSQGSKITINSLLEAAKRLAANMVSNTKIMDLRRKPSEMLAVEGRAAKEWLKFTMAAKTKEAIEAKRRQLMSNVGYKFFIEANAEIKKILDYFGKVAKETNKKAISRGRDADVVNAVRVILGAHGIGQKSAMRAAEYLDVLKRDDPEMFSMVQPAVQSALLNPTPLEQMTVEEVRALYESIQSFMYKAKRSRQIKINGKLVDIEEAEAEVMASFEKFGIPASVEGSSGQLTTAEKAANKLQWAGSILSRVRQWVERIDQGYGGALGRYTINPITDAADKYRAALVVYNNRYLNLLKGIEKLLPKGQIAAPELNDYIFGRDGKTSPMVEILHVLLHLGNESNERKMLLGWEWATEREDGTIDRTKFDAFLKRMTDTGVIRKEHYDWVQSVHDLFEETKVGAQATHRDVFGYFFNEITANSYDTPFGRYRGGYVPAMINSNLVEDKALRELAELENEGMTYSFPGTKPGFAETRVEGYNRKLLLDIRSLNQHINKVLLFTHMESAVRDVQRLLTRKKISNALFRIDPTAMQGMLASWLSTSGRQSVVTPMAGDGGLSKSISFVRNNAGMSMMISNIINALQQPTGVSSASAKLVQDGLKSNFKKSFAIYIRNPAKMTEAVKTLSTSMNGRINNELNAIQGQIEQILLNPNIWQSSKAWMQAHSYFVQSIMDNIFSIFIWNAAYNAYLEKTPDQTEAVRYADSLIKQTQGSNLPEDVSRMETGTPLERAFTQFAGWSNMMANTNATGLLNVSRGVGLRKGAGKALYILTFGVLAPLWIGQLIAVAFKGGPEDPDEDGYLDDWIFQVLGMGLLKGLLSTVPLVGTAGNTLINSFNDNPSDDRLSLSPAVSVLESTLRTPFSVYEAIVNDGSNRKAIRDVASALSLLTGQPALSAVSRPLGYLADVEAGKIEPTGTWDFTRGLLTGNPSPESVVR